MIIARTLENEQVRTYLWKSSDALRMRYERSATTAMYRTLRTITKKAGESARGANTLDEIRSLIDREIDRNEHLIAETLMRIHVAVGTAFARQTYQSVRKSEAKDDGLIRRWQRDVASFMQTRGARKIVRIAMTTKLKISQIVNRAISAGRSIPQIADEIVKGTELQSIDKMRAVVIARTETIGASNYGSIAGAESTGLELSKDWIATRDDRTRGNPAGKYPDSEFDHFAMDGVTADLKGDFSVPGKSGNEILMFPGDPSGSAENVINCRCSIGFTPKT